MTTIDRDGVRVAYEQHGRRTDRLPLLLTHGYASTAEMWQPNVATFAKDRLVITWDVRGHGRSDSPSDPSAYSELACVVDMASILDACEVPRAAIGGLSLGGYLSLAFHAVHPERTGALLLFDTGPGYRSDEGRERWNGWAEARAIDFDAHGLSNLGESAEVRRGRHDPRGLALAARGILRQSTSAVIDSLPTVRVPTLVLVGADDAPFLAAADYMASHVTGSTKVVLPAAGHASNLDQTDAFNEAVTEFLVAL